MNSEHILLLKNVYILIITITLIYLRMVIHKANSIMKKKNTNYMLNKIISINF